MSHQSDLISTDINAYLQQHEQKELMRLMTCGSVDDGKSTLIGRLLHDSKMIYEDQLSAIKSASVKSGTTGDEIDLALLVDGLQAEREQGITIDVAYRYFSTARRKFIIADTPGHEQYTRNMATGASTCDLAIILIDARYGVITQTKRHSYIASLLGIKHLLVAVNKMDLVDFKQDVFDKIRQDYLDFSKDLDANAADIHFIPLSALKGDNVVNASNQTPWYAGNPLMEILDTIQIASDRNFDDMRLPVQYVNRPNLDFRGFCGTMAGGTARKGDAITALPSGQTSRIKSIITQDGELEQAFPPQAITVTLEDEIDISRGDMIVHSDNLPLVADRFIAHVVWMTDEALTAGKQYYIKQACRTVTGSVSNFKHRIDINTLEHFDTDQLNLNEIGLCEIALNAPIAFDAYKKCKGTGSFIVIDRITNVTVGAGMITGSVSDQQAYAAVSPEERVARYSQSPVVIALSGEQRATVATSLERKLFDAGHACVVISESLDSATDQLISVLNNAGLISIFTNEQELQQPSADYTFTCGENIDASVIIEQLNRDGVLK
ncbi:MAG TPA: sulfate adenylyltransferase subunit CysN [Crenotrichaceae bacterium]|nr:sulfate adenylyltransferase subunit CysN [Crenotrichaceae bacterium]